MMRDLMSLINQWAVSCDFVSAAPATNTIRGALSYSYSMECQQRTWEKWMFCLRVIIGAHFSDEPTACPDADVVE